MAKGAFAKKLLDMAESARMTRAKDQGFYTKMPLFHGTSADISEFTLEKGGDVSGSPVGKLGVSLSTDPGTANEFANLAGSEGANVIQAYHKASKPARIELDGTETNFEIASTVQDAWGQGFDAIKFDNYTTPGGEKGRSFVLVKDPNQVRSVNARFDPNEKQSPNILSGLVPAAAIGGAVLPDNAAAERFSSRLKNVAAEYDNKLKLMQGYNQRAESPTNPAALKAAEIARSYNDWRKSNAHPIIDLLLPVGELPADVFERQAYGDNVSYWDKVKASMGMM